MCIEEDDDSRAGCSGKQLGGGIHRRLMTPVEAEERAGMGASKNWKKSLLVQLGSGEQVTLRKLLLQVGSEDEDGGGGTRGSSCGAGRGGGGGGKGGEARFVEIAAAAAAAAAAAPENLIIAREAVGFGVQDQAGEGLVDGPAPTVLWPGVRGGVRRGVKAEGGSEEEDAPTDAVAGGRNNDEMLAPLLGGSGRGGGGRTVEVVSRNGAFRGVLFLQEYLECREFGRAPGACIQEVVADGEGGDGEAERQGRMTPGEAEERAGLGSNKNWKKSFMYVGCVWGGGGRSSAYLWRVCVDLSYDHIMVQMMRRDHSVFALYSCIPYDLDHPPTSAHGSPPPPFLPPQGCHARWLHLEPEAVPHPAGHWRRDGAAAAALWRPAARVWALD